MRVGVFVLSENLRTIIGRRVEAATLTCTVVVSSMRSAARPDHRFRCRWRADGDCREERPGATVLASGVRRWEIPAHAGPVVTGSRGEVLGGAMRDPRPLVEDRGVR